MAVIKDRKVYGLKSFRGLDKENKPLQVAAYRAVDGKNFIIDSDTLKTRPAFKYLDTPLKNIDDAEIVDFYNFNEIVVYITTKGFQIKYGDKVLNKNTTPSIFSNFVLDFDFVNAKPLFQEEKDCLFIFCLGDIFVISNFYNEVNGVLEKVIIYALNDKPENPFPVSNNYYTTYNNLPIPYEPTLFIGNNTLDDVNLLSKVSKYRVFAQNTQNSQEGINVYNLPTHYDVEKHGDKPKIKVSFYNNKFQPLEIFPVFLGKLNENFFNIANYGDILNDIDAVVVQEGFVAKETFEYSGDRDSNPTPIKEILGLTKEDFFELKIKENSQKVFEYVLNYIKLNYPNNEALANKIMKFTLPYERTSNYRNTSTDVIEKTYKEQRTEDIYVQLKKFSNEVSFINKETKASATVNETVLINPYPAYPTFSTVQDLEINITPTPIKKTNYNTNDFINLANTWLELNKQHDDFDNGTVVKLLGRFFEEKIGITGEDGSVRNVDRYQEWLQSEVEEIQWGVPGSFPAFPTFDAGTNSVIDIGILSTTGQSVSLERFVDRVESDILDRIDELPSDKTVGFCKFRWQSYWNDGGTFRDIGQSVVLEFSYTKPSNYNYEKRNSFAMLLTIDKDDTSIANKLYEINFDASINCFVLKCKDYFYDFNNEPSIDVRIEFQQNPDFDIIAKSKIGITFGSENRLFLAGNKTDPNIDRFNVSNDLLGDNERNQSYELSYFPSKNYRVLGGRGAINGYVLATDTQLYITKEQYPNDQKLFIRNRTMDDNGIVGYNEFKTNIDKTPLNNKCVVRFYNDIVLLDKNGLYGVEIASNVLTNERLVKMRSGFNNRALTKDLNEYDNNNIFIFEDNAYMYIFIGKKIYVADSRYIAKNSNSEIENYSYEIVEWVSAFEFKSMKDINGKKVLLDKAGKSIYYLSNGNSDDNAVYKKFYMAKNVLEGHNTSIFFASNIKEYLTSPSGLSFSFYGVRTFKVVAKKDIDYDIEDLGNNNYKINILNNFRFRALKENDKIFLKNNFNMGDDVSFQDFHIIDFDASGRESFIIYDLNIGAINVDIIYTDVSSERLYPKIIFEKWENPNDLIVVLSPYQSAIINVSKDDFVDKASYLEAINELDDDYNIYEYNTTNALLRDTLINVETKIKLEWLSSILDFGNNLSEKTIFKTNVYGTKQEKENWIKFGYRTMRRHDRFDKTGESKMMKNTINSVEASNPIDFNEVDFNLFSINTFNEFGSSIPTKENNFLYIQILIIGLGEIEVNSVEFLYKLNRMLKTIS